MTSLPDVPLPGLYGDLILDHYRNPRHRKPLSKADVEVEEFNPFCGDRVILQLKIDEQGRVIEASAQSEGCSIIQASSSMLAQMLLGKSLAEMARIAERFRNMMRRKPSPTENPEENVEENVEDAADELGDLQSLQVVKQYPVRIKCALLPWTALEEGIEGFRSRAG